MEYCNRHNIELPEVGPCHLCVEDLCKQAQDSSPLDDMVSRDDLNLMLLWFDAVQDLNPKYLEREDYLLARRIYEKSNMRVPQSVIDGCG